MQSQLGQPINPPMDEMPDASDLGACENLPDMDLEKLDDGESGWQWQTDKQWQSVSVTTDCKKHNESKHMSIQNSFVILVISVVSSWWLTGESVNQSSVCLTVKLVWQTGLVGAVCNVSDSQANQTDRGSRGKTFSWAVVKSGKKRTYNCMFAASQHKFFVVTTCFFLWCCQLSCACADVKKSEEHQTGGDGQARTKKSTGKPWDVQLHEIFWYGKQHRILDNALL